MILNMTLILDIVYREMEKVKQLKTCNLVFHIDEEALVAVEATRSFDYQITCNS